MGAGSNYGITWPVEGPSPVAPRYTLLGAARVVDDLDAAQIERFLNGVEVYPYPPGPAHIHDACASGSSRTKDDGESVPLPIFGAMTVYLAETCSMLGISGPGLSADQEQERFVARARAALAAIESQAIEREFMSGSTLGLNPFLGDGEGAFPAANTAKNIVDAIGLLELEIADSGRQGIIHLSPAAAIKASSLNLLFEDGDVLRTITGTVVVPGTGYAGVVNAVAVSKPVGHTAPAANEEWIYATGPVEIRRSDLVLVPGELREALDRETNTITYRVERYAVLDWDTVVQAAVRVDRSLTP